MGLSEFTFRIILLFIPGIIAYIIVNNLTFHREFKVHQAFTFSLVLGFLCYMTYIPISILAPKSWGLPECTFDKVLTKPDAAINLNEVIAVTLVAIFLGIILSGLINAKWHYSIMQTLQITKKAGNSGVWVGSMYDKELKTWVIIRDLKHDLRYNGWIRDFSDTAETKELVLGDVLVDRLSTLQPLYTAPAMYISLMDEFTIEFSGASHLYELENLEGGSSEDAGEQTANQAEPAPAAAAAATRTTSC